VYLSLRPYWGVESKQNLLMAVLVKATS